MGNKNKTISFRVNEDAFETLREIAEQRDISLSAVFRDYVDMLVEHDGQINVVPKGEFGPVEGDDGEFPPTVEVPKSFIREHERLELEAEHLREQYGEELSAYKEAVVSALESLDEDDAADGETPTASAPDGTPEP